MTGPFSWRPLHEVSTSAQARALCQDLAPKVAGRASAAPADRIAAAADRWVPSLLAARAGRVGPVPDVVVWPETLDEVVAVTRYAADASVPLVPCGGGSSATGAPLALHGGIALDLKRLARLGPIDRDALEVECEAGVVGAVLERRLAREGLTLGHSPDDARAATLGGWLATRSAGLGAGRYGKLEERVATLTAVDGLGEIRVTPRRPNPGWDEASVLLGSEGCLATICSARLHVLPVPEAQVFQSFRFPGLREGVEAVRALVRAGLRPAAVRLCDPLDSTSYGEDPTPIGRRGALRRRFDEAVSVPLLRLGSRVVGERPRGLNAASRALRSCLLLLLFEGPKDLAELEAEEAGRICQTAQAEDLGADLARTWHARRLVQHFRASATFDDGGFSDTLDVAVTWDLALETYRRVREALAPLALVRGRISHAYPEGCGLEFTVVAAVEGFEPAVERHQLVWRQGLAAARSAGAVASHHGGVGLQRLNALKGQLGDGLAVLRALKAAYDPRGILNPGKLGG